jgi:hypothetical protein
VQTLGAKQHRLKPPAVVSPRLRLRLNLCAIAAAIEHGKYNGDKARCKAGFPGRRERIAAQQRPSDGRHGRVVIDHVILQRNQRRDDNHEPAEQKHWQPVTF